MVRARGLAGSGSSAGARRDRRVLEVAGAVAGVLLVAGLLVRGSIGLYRPPDEQIVEVNPRTGQIVSGDVDLRATASAPLFDDVYLAPGEARSACVAVDYRGDEVIDSVLWQLAQTTGSRRLMERLRVTVERGSVGGARCDSFVSDVQVASGSLARLASGGARGQSGWDSWTPTDGQRATYRFTVELPEGVGNKLQGDRVVTDFRWIATAVPRGADLGSRLGMLLLAFARDGIIPLLILLVVAVLFLGVQDRIDRQEPKLAYAAIADDPELFVDPARVAAAGVHRPADVVGGR